MQWSTRSCGYANGYPTAICEEGRQVFHSIREDSPHRVIQAPELEVHKRTENPQVFFSWSHFPSNVIHEFQVLIMISLRLFSATALFVALAVNALPTPVG